VLNIVMWGLATERPKLWIPSVLLHVGKFSHTSHWQHLVFGISQSTNRLCSCEADCRLSITLAMQCIIDSGKANCRPNER